MKQTSFDRADLYRFEWLGAPRVTPDGTRFAYVKKTVASDRQGYRREIFVADIATGIAAPFTQGKHKDQIADISDDAIVLLSDRAEDTQAFVLPLGGGEARQVTFIKGGVTQAAMGPGGDRLFVLLQIKQGEQPAYTSDAPGHLVPGADQQGDAGPGTPLRTGEQEDAEKKRPTPYEVKRLFYKSDGDGLWNGTYTQLAMVDLATSAVRVLTEGPFHVDAFCCSPDGEKIAYTSRRDSDDRLFFSDLYVLELATGDSVKISDGTLSLGAPVFSPDGQEVACFGNDMEFAGATQTVVYIADIEKGTLARLSPRDFVYELAASGMSDMRGHEHTPGPLFTAAGDAVLAPYSAEGSVSLAFFYRDGRVMPVVQGDREVFTYDYCARTGGVVFAATDPGVPNNLYYLEPDHVTERQLTAANEWLQERIIAPVTPFVVSGEEGRELQGWCMMPQQADGNWSEQAKTPVVLQVHGGPHAMYSWSFVFEFQLLAAAGFAVVYGNPRGSCGYGQAFVDACRGDYGGGDYRDIMAILDSALTAWPTLDGDRMGVTGGSYGGFMTNWIVGHSNRFKAAVTQRSISNWISFNGVSDIGFFFTEWEMKWSSHQTDWTDIEKLWNHSPLKYASAMQTPLLILHGEDDLRCPIEQAEQLYVALRVLDRQVEFVRFPKASHDLSRTGHPQLRVERYRYMTEWFERFV
ncbi:MAG: S9 family peptidase [Bacilli bacterium]